jgi:hypothetical protein
MMWTPGINDMSVEMAFRNFMEDRGRKYVGRRISAFQEWSGVQIAIPSNFEKIGDKCFCGCGTLCEVLIESNSNLKEIGEKSFYVCGVKWIHLPSSVERIGCESFGKCASLCEIVFECNSRLEEICLAAFILTNLKSVRVPSSVVKLENMCFRCCNSLFDIVFEPDSKVKEIGAWFCGMSRGRALDLPKGCDVLTGSSLMGLENVTVSSGNNSLVREGDFLINVNTKTLIRYFGSSPRVLVNREIEVISPE